MQLSGPSPHDRHQGRVGRLRATLRRYDNGSETGIEFMPQNLQRLGLAPPSTGNFLDALRVMNAAAHGMKVDANGAERAVRLGTKFPTELTGLRGEW